MSLRLLKQGFGLAALVTGFLAAPGTPAAAKTVPYEWSHVSRIVAIGDVHGAYENLVAVLENTGLVDDKLRWIGGKTQLVQVGDVVDRGADSRKCMDLLMRLEKDAKKAGGYVHALIGNHEAMNLVGILDYTSAEELGSYDGPQARRAREKAFHIYYDEQRADAKAAGRRAPSKEEARWSFDDKYPRGYFGHRLAFGPNGRYGKWIRGHNVSIRINGIVFSHGDWSEEVSTVGLEEMNHRVRAELSGEAPLPEGLTFHLKGPLQYRGLSEVILDSRQQESFAPKVDRILKNLGARRLVVGHTTTDGIIEPRFGGKHISVDVGMLDLYQGGHQVALEIVGESLYAVHPDGKVEVPERLDQTNVLEYVSAAAAVDPRNANVHRRLAEAYMERGEHDKARGVLERLFRVNGALPFRYRRLLGDVYNELGRFDKAREQYLLFISEFESFIEKAPHNPHIRNTLARFCLAHDLRPYLAAEHIEAALRLEPDNAAFLLTRGRLHLAQHRFRKAVEALEKVVQRQNPGYEAFYYLGLAYLGLGDTNRARRAFRAALEKDPTRPEAREELLKLNRPARPQEGGAPC